MVTTTFLVVVDDNARELERARPWTATIRSHDGALLAAGFGRSQSDAVQNAFQDPLSSWTRKLESSTAAPPVAQAARGTETRADPACAGKGDELHGPTPMP
ncbi:hypothetical protein C8K30_1011044 [Promicromonospora sp. AC04]|uniref:hypothetical protein n=1 Tax=Promicromonospora sp. AC04 TaxID=2135723 RepID=UPI000D337D04|nr:hypothetical protein [Promicromonospora sp. AC04]PUB32518.1 hypothetical protein C8K30_1011044 [Promicromonospora sp. AC04]